MSKIPGRSAWLAWPVGVLCVAILAGLVYLGAPIVPAITAYAGQTLRESVSAPTPAPSQADALEIAEGGGWLDCRRLYPSDLWAELAWAPGSLLDQTRAAPPTSVPAAWDAFAPTVRVTCRWTLPGGTVTTTLAKVSPDAAPAARAQLEATGFSCADADGGVLCRATKGGVTEEQTLRGDLLLVTVGGAGPDDYTRRLVAGLWG